MISRNVRRYRMARHFGPGCINLCAGVCIWGHLSGDVALAAFQPSFNVSTPPPDCTRAKPDRGWEFALGNGPIKPCVAHTDNRQHAGLTPNFDKHTSVPLSCTRNFHLHFFSLCKRKKVRRTPIFAPSPPRRIKRRGGLFSFSGNCLDAQNSGAVETSQLISCVGLPRFCVLRKIRITDLQKCIWMRQYGT